MHVAMGMMLRDVLHSCTLQGDPHPQEREAQRLAQKIQESIEAWLDRNHRMDLFPRQHALLHQAITMAVEMDSMDFDQIPTSEISRQARDHEETHLMVRVNNMVRTYLTGRSEGERMRRLRLIEEAVRNQLGSESRHLRRLGVALHGLQMVGGTAEEAEQRETDHEWLPQVVDEFMLMANQEDPHISDEGVWTQEVNALRRWLAEDRLRPDVTFRTSSSQAQANASDDRDMSRLGAGMNVYVRDLGEPEGRPRLEERNRLLKERTPAPMPTGHGGALRRRRALVRLEVPRPHPGLDGGTRRKSIYRRGRGMLGSMRGISSSILWMHMWPLKELSMAWLLTNETIFKQLSRVWKQCRDATCCLLSFE